MKLNPIAQNQNEIELNDKVIFISYQTPVAYWESGKGAFKTEKKWSVTTSKHVNQWLRGKGYNPAEVPTVPQNLLDGLL
jgi:hypothetical protein